VPQGAPEEESGGFEPSSGSEQQAAGASSETTAESGSGFAFAQGEAGDEYLPLDWVSKPPLFSDEAIRRRLRYPPLALRANIEGLVYLELFVDRSGAVKMISILNEDPPGRGFGEAALRAFEGLRGVPAELNGSPVAVRYRYPLRFTIR
jgi:protein TonB